MSDTSRPIGDLWPTEPVVTEESVDQAKSDLQAGKGIAPVATFEAAGRTLVRDGNNRVRAWVEHYGAAGGIPEVPCCPNETRPRDGWQGPEIADHFGHGEQAFRRLAKVPKAKYDEAQREFWRKRRESS